MKFALVALVLLVIAVVVGHAEAQTPVERGKYLVEVSPDGGMDTTRLFAGGFKFGGPWGVSYSSNLTPDRETGIGAWTDAQIVAAMYGVKPNGRPVLPPMPWPYYAGRIAGDDLKAIVAYLRSLRPLRHVVPPADRPRQ